MLLDKLFQGEPSRTQCVPEGRRCVQGGANMITCNVVKVQGPLHNSREDQYKKVVITSVNYTL